MHGRRQGHVHLGKRKNGLRCGIKTKTRLRGCHGWQKGGDRQAGRGNGKRKPRSWVADDGTMPCSRDLPKGGPCVDWGRREAGQLGHIEEPGRLLDRRAPGEGCGEIRNQAIATPLSRLDMDHHGDRIGELNLVHPLLPPRAVRHCQVLAWPKTVIERNDCLCPENRGLLVWPRAWPITGQLRQESGVPD